MELVLITQTKTRASVGIAGIIIGDLPSSLILLVTKLLLNTDITMDI